MAGYWYGYNTKKEPMKVELGLVGKNTVSPTKSGSKHVTGEE